MWQLSRQNISFNKPTICLQLIISHEKKAGPGQIRIQDFCRPRRIRCLQVQRAGDAAKFEFIMKQDTN